jgi:cobalt-zinc-cadmium efflux system membrane fusion protein
MNHAFRAATARERLACLVPIGLILATTGCHTAANQSQPGSSSDAAKPRSADGLITLPADSPQLSRIRVAVVEATSVPRHELIVPGKVELNPARVSRLAMPVAGRVRQVLVSLGDAVQQGQTVVAVDSPDVGAALSAYRQAEANVLQAKAGLTKTEADLNRARDLLEHHAIAQKEVLNAETAVVQSKSLLAQAQAALDDTRHRLQIMGLQPGGVDQYISVKAPVSGKVMEISVVPGEYRTDTTNPVMTIADLSSVWVSADVPEDKIRFIRTGEGVAITLNAFPGETFRGRVARIADALDPQTRTIKVRAELANPHGRFRPDMFAQIRHSEGTKRLPVVPRGAVLQSEGRSTVYVERSRGAFQEVPVTIAWQRDDRVALSGGVSAGDRVVVEGTMLLKAF